mgnify:CR=1 FL=1|jgi:3-hydroxybutyryl-CoA dehydratase
MNNYALQEIQLGLKEYFEVTITKDMLASFQTITGDSNPLHSNLSYAQSKGFPDRVIYGMLTASFLSTLAGVYLPGMESLIHNVNVNFHNPVFIGDVLTVAGEVREKDERFEIIKLKIKISNQKSIRVVSGSMQIGLIEDLKLRPSL